MLSWIATMTRLHQDTGSQWEISAYWAQERGADRPEKAWPVFFSWILENTGKTEAYGQGFSTLSGPSLPGLGYLAHVKH